MGSTTRGVVLTIAAMAIPLCVSTSVFVFIEMFADHWNTFLRWAGPFELLVVLGAFTIGPAVGFAVIIRAFRGRWLMLTGLAALYFPFWWSILPFYGLIMSQFVAQYTCNDPRPGACWP